MPAPRDRELTGTQSTRFSRSEARRFRRSLSTAWYFRRPAPTDAIAAPTLQGVEGISGELLKHRIPLRTARGPSGPGQPDVYSISIRRDQPHATGPASQDVAPWFPSHDGAQHGKRRGAEAHGHSDGHNSAGLIEFRVDGCLVAL